VKGATKSKGTFELGGRRITTKAVPGKALIDASRFIPVVLTGTQASSQVRVIDRVDLLGDHSTVAPPAAATIHYGDILVDTFTPTYGSYYPIGQPAFIIEEVRVRLILNSLWSMLLPSGDAEDQVLDFKIMKGINANYLKVLIGHTLDNLGNGAIMTVRTNGAQFNLDLKAQTYHYFDLVVLGDSSADRDVRFTLNSAANQGRQAVCPIFQIELYNTIRVFPEPPLING
jgi:hypothetical protein